MSIANQSVEALDVSGVDEAKNKRIEWNEKTRLLIPSSLIGNADLWVHEFNEMSIFEVLPENLRFGGVTTTLRGVRQKTRITHILVAFHSVSCFRGEILLPEKFAKEIVFEKRWRARDLGHSPMRRLLHGLKSNNLGRKRNCATLLRADVGKA